MVHLFQSILFYDYIFRIVSVHIIYIHVNPQYLDTFAIRKNRLANKSHPKGFTSHGFNLYLYIKGFSLFFSITKDFLNGIIIISEKIKEPFNRWTIVIWNAVHFLSYFTPKDGIMLNIVIPNTHS